MLGNVNARVMCAKKTIPPLQCPLVERTGSFWGRWMAALRTIKPTISLWRDNSILLDTQWRQIASKCQNKKENRALCGKSGDVDKST